MQLDNIDVKAVNDDIHVQFQQEDAGDGSGRTGGLVSSCDPGISWSQHPEHDPVLERRTRLLRHHPQIQTSSSGLLLSATRTSTKVI